jgi:8-oxo-dGTP pyrophosphatase MutT (NUDIX family)
MTPRNPRPRADQSATADTSLADLPVDRTVITSTTQFHGRVWGIRTDLVDLGDGQQVERDVVQHPGAVGILAVDDTMQVLLVRQYRHPVAAMLWEPPAGLLDVPGEDPRDAAARELFEEAGYRAATWSVLLDVFMSPGGSNESVRIFLARGLTEVAADERHIGEAEERGMISRWVGLEAARAAVLAGDLHSPLCIMGVLAACNVLLDGVGSTRSVKSPWLRSGVPGGGARES